MTCRTSCLESGRRGWKKMSASDLSTQAPVSQRAPFDTRTPVSLSDPPALDHTPARPRPAELKNVKQMYRDLIKKTEGQSLSPASSGTDAPAATDSDVPCVVLCYGAAAAERARKAAAGGVVPDMASSIELTAVKEQLKRAQAERDEVQTHTDPAWSGCVLFAAASTGEPSPSP